ncbi:hypothetical protein [Streptomyces sp. NPDC056169]|uniref:hypothetical protein n=1 Tax=Streptomyces sp. NPDC056169 TaxID=3345734 RepID=UPI0035D79006
MTDVVATVPTSSVDMALDRIRGRLTEAGLGRSTAELGTVATFLLVTYRQAIAETLFPEQMNTLGFRLGDVDRLLDDTFGDLVAAGDAGRARRLNAIRAAVATLDTTARTLVPLGEQAETSAAQGSALGGGILDEPAIQLAPGIREAPVPRGGRFPYVVAVGQSTAWRTHSRLRLALVGDGDLRHLHAGGLVTTWASRALALVMAV